MKWQWALWALNWVHIGRSYVANMSPMGSGLYISWREVAADSACCGDVLLPLVFCLLELCHSDGPLSSHYFRSILQHKLARGRAFVHDCTPGQTVVSQKTYSSRSTTSRLAARRCPPRRAIAILTIATLAMQVRVSMRAPSYSTLF